MQNQLPKSFFLFTCHFLKQYKLIVAIFCFLGFCAGFWGPFNNILVKQLIDLLPHAREDGFGVLAPSSIMIVANFIIFDNFTWRMITYIRGRFAPLIINNIVSKLTDHCFAKSNQFYQNNLTGKLSKQIFNLADGVESMISNIIPNFLRGGSVLVAAFVASYFVNPIFFYILIIWFIIFAGISLLMSKKVVLLSDAQASAESAIVGELVDSLSNHSNIRAFARRRYEDSRMAPFYEKQVQTYRNSYFYYLIMHGIQGGLIAIMMGFSCYFLVDLYSKDLVTIGDFALILGLAMETGHMTWYTMSWVDECNKVVGKCKQGLAVLAASLEIQDKIDAKLLICHKGEITFDNVKFHYLNTGPLFTSLSIKIKAGERVGLVGYSGSGKSTFANLLLRFYDVTDGSILIDGQNIQDCTQDSLRENISIIPQDPSLFQRSIMENIRYGKIGATDEEVMLAAKKAHAHEFIATLSEGYNSLVGERGIKLSGGQRQRIAIARAFLKNAPILILDEATSQLDSVTENLIQDSLWELMNSSADIHFIENEDVKIYARMDSSLLPRMTKSEEGNKDIKKTVLVIAHRLSTLLHMDRILVFDKGDIVEDGTHKELLAKKGTYKKLWDSQIGGFLGDKESEK